MNLTFFSIVIDVAESAQKPRHQIAHWIWGRCPELRDDALLLAEPKKHRERDHQLLKLLRTADDGAFWNAEMADLNQYDPAAVMVYRRPNLERAKRDIAEAAKTAHLLVVFLDEIFTGRRKPVTGNDPAEMRKLLFEMLCDGRQFREAWDQLQAARQNNAQ